MGLLVAALAILPFVHVPGPLLGPSLGLRVSGALLPAFGIMGLVLAPTLAWFYARHAQIDPIAAIAGSTLAYLIALPPFAGTALEYLRTSGQADSSSRSVPAGSSHSARVSPATPGSVRCLQFSLLAGCALHTCR